MRRFSLLLPVCLLAGLAVTLLSRDPQADPRLKGSFRRPDRNGWVYVHLEGPPKQLGYQHGYLLAPEIEEDQKIIAMLLERDTKQDWSFFRNAAKEIMWPHIEQEYRDELQGIAEGLHAHGVKLDAIDMATMNAWQEWDPYYMDWYKEQHKSAKVFRRSAPEHCSAFAATGSYTRDGRIVIGHNAWTGYMEGERWNIIFDLKPASGSRILMDGFPGLIHSGDDFGLNSAGIVITETTISQFSGFDPQGIPEFVRARKAMQYSNSIDDFVRIMSTGNNGAYANSWLLADRKTNEVAELELGLKNVNCRRTRDGYFVGANFPVNEKLAREETRFPLDDLSLSPNSRHVRWDQLMAEYKGKIDVAAGEKFLADHYDAYEKKVAPSERTLCGHIDLSPRGMKPWQDEYAPAGAVQNKVADAQMAARMSFMASMGHSCGIDFKAADHLRQHPAFNWQKPTLVDMNSNPWTEFTSAQK